MKPYNNRESKGVQVQRMFNSIAPRYDLLNTILSLGIDRRWRKAVIKRIEGVKVLDLATGTADMAIMIAKTIPNSKITAVDISEKMMQIGQRKVQEAGLEDRVDFKLSFAEKLDLESESFDTVTVAFGVRNFEDIPKGLGEIRRVLRSGGKAYILEFSTPKSKIFGAVYSLYFHKIVPLLGRMLSADQKAYDYLPESVDNFPSPEKFRQMALTAGFNEVNIVPLTQGVANIYIMLKE